MRAVCKNSLDIRGAKSGGRRKAANGEPEIYASVTCGGSLLYNDTKRVSEIVPVAVEGTPMTLFPRLQNYSAMVLISEYQEEDYFVVKNSEFVAVPSLESSDEYNGQVRAPLLIQDSNVLVHNVTFARNTGFQAGAVYLQLSQDGEAVRDKLGVHISACRFESNEGGIGGAIVMDGFPSVVVRNCNFTTNDPEGVKYTGKVGEKLSILGCTFSGNKDVDTGRYGGVFGNGPGLLTVEGSTFQGNEGKKGGAIYWENKVSEGAAAVAVNGSIFEDNQATSAGGAIFIGAQTALTIFDTHFKKNKADEGGAIQLMGATVTDIRKTKFETNVGELEGGAIFFRESEPSFFQSTDKDSSGGIVLTNVQFIENQSPSGKGGACSFQGGALKMSSCLLRGNMAEDTGGALFAGASDSLLITNSTFESNSVTQDSGGAISAGAEGTGAVKKLIISNSIFRNNTASTPCDVSTCC